jgi:uncharacterized pyridoxamine 5'-phosphate oxidase family protein
MIPSLKDLYAVGDGKFEIFYLDEAQAVCSTLSGETQTLAL